MSTQHRRFRFGIQAAKPPTNVTWQELARRAETLGYAALTIPDHFNDQYAPIPAMMSALEVTTSLRVCALVFDNDYKHPVVLAKELATMDVLSVGRIEIGLGAGWMRTDYDELGITYDSPGTRIDRFVEGLEIVRRCMRGDAFSFEGTHYTIRNHTPTPRAAQLPCPPVLIGAGGKRMLGIAAREADIVGINPSLAPGAVGPTVINDMSVEAFEDKVETVRRAAGDRFASIELNVRAFLVNVTNDAAAARDGLAAMLGVTSRMIAESPFALVGSPEELIDRLVERRERFGVSYVIVGGDDVESFAPVVAQLADR